MSDPATYVLVPGVDPTSTFEGYASVLLQMFQMATPSPYYGVVIFSHTTPATTGQPTGYPANWYELNKRCIWFNTTDNLLYRYIDGTGWSADGMIPDDSITAAKIKDAVVSMAKLDPAGFVNGDVIYFNGTNFIPKALGAAIADGSISLGKLSLSGSAEGYVVRIVGGVAVWSDMTASITTIANAAATAAVATALATYTVTIAQISHAGAATVQGIFFNGTAWTYGYADQYLRDGYVTFGKLLTPASSANKLLIVDPTGTFVDVISYTDLGTAVVTLAAVTAALATTKYATAPVDQVSISAATVTPASLDMEFLHGLGAVPSKVRVVYVLQAARGGYLVGEEIPAGNVSWAGVASEFRAVSDTKIFFHQGGRTGGTAALKNKTGTGTTATVDDDFKIKAYAEL